MLDDQQIHLFLTLALIIYLVVHVPLDIFMLLKRDKSVAIRNYNLRVEKGSDFLIGLPSTLLWITWFTLVAIWWLDADYIGYFRYSLPHPAMAFMLYTGAALISIGLILMCWSRILRGKYASAWGLSDEAKLVTSGPYRFIRHPTYTFYILFFLGFPLLTSLWPLFVLNIGSLGYIKIISVEEEMLTLHFGEEYTSYQQKTKKFIPFIW